MWTKHPASPPGWAVNAWANRSSRVSCQGNRDCTICSTTASSVDTGLCELFSMVLRLLVCDVGQETQRDRVPLLWQQQEQEPQTDDAGGCQTHHAEDDLMFQNIYGCSRWKIVDSEGVWGRNKHKFKLINWTKDKTAHWGCRGWVLPNTAYHLHKRSALSPVS